MITIKLYHYSVGRRSNITSRYRMIYPALCVSNVLLRSDIFRSCGDDTIFDTHIRGRELVEETPERLPGDSNDDPASESDRCPLFQGYQLLAVRWQ